MSHELDVRVETELENQNWDRFVDEVPGAHHEQTTGWARAKHFQGWRPTRVLIYRNQQLVGGAQILHRRVRRFFRLAIISRAPLCNLSDPISQDAVARLVLASLRAMKPAYAVVVPTYGGESLAPLLREDGFFPKPNALPPVEVVTATLLLDLKPSLDSLFSGMRESTRKNIRRGLKKASVLQEEGASGVPTFFRLMADLCARRGATPIPNSPAFFTDLFRTPESCRHSHVFILRHGDIPIAAAFAFTTGRVLRVWKVGWAPEYESFYPNYVLRWKLIEWAKNCGLKAYDCVQILPTHAAALLRGEVVDDGYWGVTQFKLGFGGNLIMLPEPQFRSFNPAIQCALRFGGIQTLDSRFGRRITSWVERLTQGARE